MQVFAATLEAGSKGCDSTVVCPSFAMHGWFSHSGSPQTKSSAVRASASGAVAVTSARTGIVVRTAAADAVAGMSMGPAVNASAPGGTDVVCARRSKKTRSSLEPQLSSEPQTCFARRDGPRLHYGSVPPPPPCCWSPYRKLWYSRKLGVLLLLCCYGTGTRCVDHGTLSPAVITLGCHNDNEALPQGVWYTPYPG